MVRLLGISVVLAAVVLGWVAITPTVDAQGSTRTFLPTLHRDPLPTPTPTPEALTDLERWYLGAQEVPGTRITKTVDGKECLLRSIADPGAAYEFRWRDDPNTTDRTFDGRQAYFPESVAVMRDSMCEDQRAQGYDELVIAEFASVATAPRGAFYGELLGNESDGTQTPFGHYGYHLMEINGRRIRIAVHAPPTTTGPSIREYTGRGSAGWASLDLLFVSVCADTPPARVTTAQNARIKELDDHYVNAVRLVRR